MNLENILNLDYGVGILYADEATVEWAADKLGDTELAKRQIKKLNRHRAKFGVRPIFMPYGSKYF